MWRPGITAASYPIHREAASWAASRCGLGLPKGAVRREEYAVVGRTSSWKRVQRGARLRPPAASSRLSAQKSPRKQRVRGGQRTPCISGSDWTVRRASLCAVPLATGRRPCFSAGILANFGTRWPAETPSPGRRALQRQALPTSRFWSIGSPRRLGAVKRGGKIGQWFSGVKADFHQGDRATKHVANIGRVACCDAVTEAGTRRGFRRANGAWI